MRSDQRLSVRAVVCCALLWAGSSGAVLCQIDPERGWLGVTLEDRKIEVSESSFEEPEYEQAVFIQGIVRDSPADEAGLRANDRLLSIDQVPLTGTNDVIEAIGRASIGKWIRVEYERAGRTRNVQARLSEPPESRRNISIKQAWAGVELLDVPQQLREHWGGDAERGVLVAEVDPAGPAMLGGLLPGDLLLEIAGEPFAQSRRAQRRLMRGGIGNEIELLISRQGSFIELELELLEEPQEPTR